MNASQLKHHLVTALGIAMCGFISRATEPADALVSLADETAVATRLNYVQTDTTQYIDTGLPGQTGLVADLDMMGFDTGADYGLLGMREADNKTFCLAHYSTYFALAYGATAGWSNPKVKPTFTANTRFLLHSEMWNGSQTLAINGVVKTSLTQKGDVSYTKPLALFAFNNKGTISGPGKWRLYRCTIKKVDGESETVLRDFVPWRTAEGQVGLYDLAATDPSTAFYAPMASGSSAANALAWSIAYTNEETKMFLREGTLAANDDDFRGWTEVEKVSAGTVNAAAAKDLTFPDLTLTDGTFALQDGAAKTYAVNGDLTLNGGATLAIDCTADACDSFAPTGLVTLAATGEKPLVVKVAVRAFDFARNYVLVPSGIAGANGVLANVTVETDDAEKPMCAELKDGALVVHYSDPTVPVTAKWVGTATSSVADAASWECRNVFGEVLPSVVPTEKMTVTIPDGSVLNVPAGTEMFNFARIVWPAFLGGDCDWSGLVNVTLEGTIDLRGHVLSLANDAVQPKNKVGFVSYDLIKDGSFDLVGQVSVVTPHPFWSSSGKSGVINRNNSSWCSSLVAISQFNWFAVQKTGAATATILVPEAGDYTIRYIYHKRNGDAGDPGHQLAVKIDGGDEPWGVTTADESWGRAAFTGHLTAGEHTLSLVGLTEDDKTTLIDNLSFTKVGAPVGTVRIPVAANTTNALATTVGWGVRVEKTGAGVLDISDRTLSMATDVLVSEGRLRISHDKTAEGPSLGGTMRVARGATLDNNFSTSNGASDYTRASNEMIYGKTVILEGAIVNEPMTGKDAAHTMIGHLVVKDGATLGAADSFRIDIRGNMDGLTGGFETTTALANRIVEGGTLTVLPSDAGRICFWMDAFALDRLENYGWLAFESVASGAITNGIRCHGGSALQIYDNSILPQAKVIAEDGTVALFASGSAAMSSFDLNIASGATVTNAARPTVSRLNFTFAGRLSGGGAIATDGTQFQFGTGWTWAIKAAGRQVVEKVELRDLENENSSLFMSMDKLTRLEVANIGDEPLAPKLAICRAGNLTDAQARDVTVLITEKDGVQRTTGTLMVEETYGVNMLYLHVADGSPIYRATWTGAGETGNLADPANWACSNETGLVEGRLPTADTDVTMPVGTVVDIPSGAPFVCKSFAMDGALSLERNVDWSGLGVPLDGIVYLNGHTLALPSLAGTAQIFNSPEAGYETLDFIEATGTQAINTEYYFGAKDVFVVDAYIPTSQAKTHACLFGTRNNKDNEKNSTSFWLAISGKNTMGYIRAGGAGGVNRDGNGKFEYGRRVTITCCETNASWVTSGGETAFHNVSPTDTDVGGYAPLAIFGINNGFSETDFAIDENGWCCARLYSFRIYDEDGTTLKRSYTPARRKCDGVAGLWESVEGRFFASASETQLLSGPVTRTPTDAEMGTVRVTLAEGVQVPAGSSSVRMTGAIRYVQDGPGELAAAVTAVADAAKVELAAGTLKLTAATAASLNAAIVNDGTLAKEGSGVVTLTAALSGHGALQGANLRFDGTLSAWDLAADATGWTAKVSVDGVSDTAFLKGLETIAVAYAGDATKSAYLDLAPAGALTAADVSNIVLRVTDANAQDVSDASALKLANSRLLLAIAEGETVTSATWTGLGDVTNLSDPANWECKNDEIVVENAIPTAETVVTLPADCSFNCPEGAAFACKQVVVPATIADDLDWRGLTAPLTGLMDLKGRTLRLGPVTGDVVITDSTGPDFVELEHIEATGTQAINTEYYFGAKDVFVVDAYIPTSQAKTHACLFGTRNNKTNEKNSTSFWLAISGKNTMGYIRAGGAGGVNRNGNSKFEYGRRVTITCCETSASWVRSDGETAFHNVSPTDTDVGGYAPLAIFGINNGLSPTDFTIDANGWCCAQLYSFKIYDEDGTTLKRSYVPAFRTSDGEVGLWEEAEERFFDNAGSGDFKYGKMKRIDGLVSGEVHIDVPEGATRTLGAVAFRGNVRVVKDGGGMLVLNTTPLSFNIGGWDITAGTVKAAANLTSSRPFGLPGAVVTVREGATYDLNGKADSRAYRFVLDGGTIANTGADVGSEIGCMGEITLTKDSYLDVSRSFPLWGVVDLGGHDLSIAIATSKNLYLREGEGSIGGTFTNGSVTVTTGGWLTLCSKMTASGRDMRTVDFTVGAAFNLGNSISVGNLEPKYAYNQAQGNGNVSIYGVFTPNEKNYLNNFVLQDGATLNLANWVGPYDIAKSVQPGQVLGFAENATVYVSLGRRRISSSQPVVVWPANAKPNVKFRPASGSGYGFIAKDDGLYVVKGMTIILR